MKSRKLSNGAAYRPVLPKIHPHESRKTHILEWVRIEEFTDSTWCGVGRPPHERAWLANAFVAKKVLGLTTTIGLIERLSVDRALRRICGFPLCKKLPSEATFSRAFEEFAEGHLPQRVPEALIKEYLGDELHRRAAVADGEVGAVERAVLALHQAVLELAFIHALDQIERARTELHAVVLTVMETVVAVSVGQAGKARRGGHGHGQRASCDFFIGGPLSC